MLHTERRAIDSAIRFGTVSTKQAQFLYREDAPFRDPCDSFLQHVSGGFFDESDVSGYSDFLLGTFAEYVDGTAATTIAPVVLATLRSAQAMVRSGYTDSDIAAFIAEELGTGTDMAGGVALYCRMILARLHDHLTHPYIAAYRLRSMGGQLDADYRDTIETGTRLAGEWEKHSKARGAIEKKITQLAETEIWPSIR